MDFLKRLFSHGGKKEYLDGTWTTIYPTDAIERNLLNGNKEWVFISVDGGQGRRGGALPGHVLRAQRRRRASFRRADGRPPRGSGGWGSSRRSPVGPLRASTPIMAAPRSSSGSESLPMPTLIVTLPNRNRAHVDGVGRINQGDHQLLRNPFAVDQNPDERVSI
jgi:hypothetical protein